MFAGTALSVRLLVYAGLSLFIISGPYLYVVVCVLYAYNLTMVLHTVFNVVHNIGVFQNSTFDIFIPLMQRVV